MGAGHLHVRIKKRVRFEILSSTIAVKIKRTDLNRGITVFSLTTASSGHIDE